MMRALSYVKTMLKSRRRETVLPRFLTYIVTFSCNARCIMCDSWRKPSPNDLTIDEVDRIFGELPRLDAIRLTGGEPFVRKDLIDIADLAQRRLKPLVLHVTTNGFLTDRIVKFCEERRKDVPLNLLISVDGVGDKHNEVRGHDKAWSFIVQTIQELAPRRRELGLRLAVNQTIVDPEGVHHYKLLRDFLRPFNIHNHVVMAYDMSATYSLNEKVVAGGQIGDFTTFGNFTAAHLNELFDEIEKDLPNFPFWERMAKRYYMKGIRNRLLRQQGTPNPPCVATNAHMRLMPDGRVPTCQFNSTPAGNLREQSFSELWFSPEAQRQREWVAKCPGCWAECEVLPSAIYSGDLVQLAKPSRRPAEPAAVAAPRPVSTAR